MPPGTARVVAVDLGASSGRVFVAELGEKYFEFDQVHRFWNGAIRAGGHIHWDVLGLYRGILDGVRAAGRTGHLDSIGIDSWGVDYGLLDADGTLLGNPVHYRDDRTRAVVDPVVKSVGALELYRRSGIAVVPFNTIFQLAAGRDDAQFTLARTLLLVPDLLAVLAHGISRRRGDQRVDDPAAQSRRIRMGCRADRKGRRLPGPFPADSSAWGADWPAPCRCALRDGP